MIQEPELAGDSRETVSSRNSKADLPMNPQRIRHETQDLYKFRPDKISMLKGDVESSTPNQEALFNWYVVWKGNSVTMECYRVYQPHSSVTPCPGAAGQTQKWFQTFRVCAFFLKFCFHTFGVICLFALIFIYSYWFILVFYIFRKKDIERDKERRIELD